MDHRDPAWSGYAACDHARRGIPPREERRRPQPAVGVASSDDREVAVSQEATIPPLRSGVASMAVPSRCRLRRYPGTALDGEFALMEILCQPSRHVQYRLARDPAVEQRLSRFGYIVPRRPQPDLRIDSPAARSSTR